MVFADTLYWVAITNPRDQWHEVVVQATENLGDSRIITTDEVLIEYLNAFASIPHLRKIATERVRRMRTNANIEIMAQSAASFEAGLSLYEQRPDKMYSLTDCISMETMRQRGITDTLTRDHHFEQEGFVLLID